MQRSLSTADLSIRKTWTSIRPRTTCETKRPGRRNPLPLLKSSMANPNSDPCATRRISMPIWNEVPCPVRIPSRRLATFRLNLRIISSRGNMRRTLWTSDHSASPAWPGTTSEPLATIISLLHHCSNVKNQTGPTSNPTMIISRHTSRHPLTRRTRPRVLISPRTAMLLPRCRGRAFKAL